MKQITTEIAKQALQANSQKQQTQTSEYTEDERVKIRQFFQLAQAVYPEQYKSKYLQDEKRRIMDMRQYGKQILKFEAETVQQGFEWLQNNLIDDHDNWQYLSIPKFIGLCRQCMPKACHKPFDGSLLEHSSDSEADKKAAKEAIANIDFEASSEPEVVREEYRKFNEKFKNLDT